jgi:hypothetical protein
VRDLHPASDMKSTDEREQAQERMNELQDILGDRASGVTLSVVPWGQSFVIRFLDPTRGRMSDFPLSVPPKQMVREFFFPDMPEPQEIDPTQH